MFRHTTLFHCVGGRFLAPAIQRVNFFSSCVKDFGTTNIIKHIRISKEIKTFFQANKNVFDFQQVMSEKSFLSGTQKSLTAHPVIRVGDGERLSLRFCFFGFVCYADEFL